MDWPTPCRGCGQWYTALSQDGLCPSCVGKRIARDALKAVRPLVVRPKEADHD